MTMPTDIDAGFHSFRDPETGEPFGSFEVFYDDADENLAGEPRNFDANGEPVRPGWYWWACFPGCLPDGEATGPFITSTHARWNAIDTI